MLGGSRLSCLCVLPFLALICSWRGADALCMPEHPQAAVCRADFVIKVKVISTDWEGDLMRAAKPDPTTPATTRAIVTEEVTTEAATTAAATEAATTAAAKTVAATEEATTQAAMTVAASKEAKKVVPTTAAKIKEQPEGMQTTTKELTDSRQRTATNSPPENPDTENKLGSNKNRIKESTDAVSKPELQPAFIGQSAYSLKPQVIRLELLKLYKGRKDIGTPGHQLNVTFSSPHRTHLEAGKIYLLTGFRYDETLLMNECNWHMEWENLTVTQKLGLRRYYWLYCRCRIRFCPGGRCDRDPRVCSWVLPINQIDGKKADNLSKNKVCMVRCGGCGWYNPKEYGDCETFEP